MVSTARTSQKQGDVERREPTEEEIALRQAEAIADTQALEGATMVENMRATCGAQCLEQADALQCRDGKVNGSIDICRNKLHEAIFKLRLSAHRAWLKILNHLGKVKCYGENSEHTFEYSELFKNLFEHGPIAITQEILTLSHSTDSISIDEETRILYADAREKLIRYLHVSRLINKPEDFAHDLYELVLFISCFAELDDLEILQSHILEGRRKTKACALTMIDN